MNMLQFITQPWPWYVAGPLIGLTVPALLFLGNKSFGISSSMRHVCAACFPSNIPYFTYDWKKEIWNLVFVSGILLGGILAFTLLNNHEDIVVAESLKTELSGYGINDYSSLVPVDIFNWDQIFTLKGFLMMVFGGFIVGFGTRYAGGCTSGHSIMGLSSLQWPSLVATCCFMLGGILTANFLLPFILSL
ncbi:MAG: YeeE/YedE family protein [Saprospiraceae bacterium]|nr:YeeE/YedE family protein [Saprospiraceae bacterium]